MAPVVRLVHGEGLIPFQLYALPRNKGLQASFYPHARASESLQQELTGELLEEACRAFEARWETSATFIDASGAVHRGLLERARAISKAEPRPTRPSSNPIHATGSVKGAEGRGAPQLGVFISYAHADKRLLEKLKKHLSSLQREGLISTWHDGQLHPGDVWRRELLVRLDEAKIILLLVSADFIASDFCCTTELERALERHEQGEALVLPIILRSVDWESSHLHVLQGLPDGGKPVQLRRTVDDGFVNVAKGLRRAIARFGQRGPDSKG